MPSDEIEVPVQLECVCPHTQYGQSVWVVGDSSTLGYWKIHNALKLQTGPDVFPTWRLGKAGVKLARNNPIEFKFLIMTDDKHYVQWEPTCNRKLTVDSPVIYQTVFGEAQNAHITAWEDAPCRPAMNMPSLSEPRPPATWLGRVPDASSASLQRLSSFSSMQQLPHAPSTAAGTACWGHGMAAAAAVSGGACCCSADKQMPAASSATLHNNSNNINSCCSEEGGVHHSLRRHHAGLNNPELKKQSESADVASAHCSSTTLSTSSSGENRARLESKNNHCAGASAAAAVPSTAADAGGVGATTSVDSTTATSSSGGSLNGAAATRCLSSPALRMLVEGDRAARCWREKIELVKHVLLSSGLKDGGKMKYTQDELLSVIDGLSYSAIYLRFIALGDIACVEDGRHYRPNHHAMLSRELCVLLEQLMLDVNNRDDALGDAVRLLVRAVAPSLPSFHTAFTAAQPLTRIRDIAHRNDIPPQLKDEIKRSLQNKLHRCAGPEDLLTTERFLARFHAHRDAYPKEFLAEFEHFYDELKRFFNATDLETRLNEMRLEENPRMRELITRFLEAKARSDDPGASISKLLVTLSMCLELRSCLNYQLRDNGPVAADREAAHHVQEMRLAEVLLDDVAFVLLSRAENLLTQVPDGRWAEAVEALALGVKDVKISGLRRDECRALSAELATHACRVVQAPEDWLVMKATLERVHRLSEDFTDLQLALFSGRSIALGRELSLPSPSVRLYTEATVRSSVVFQSSKICTSLLRRIRLVLNLQPYDVLVPGEAVGMVLLCDSLEEGVMQCMRMNNSDSETCQQQGKRPQQQQLSDPQCLQQQQQQQKRQQKLEEEGAAVAADSEKAKEAPLIAAPPVAFSAEQQQHQQQRTGGESGLPGVLIAARSASGDEELGGLDGPNWKVEGIVIGHDMPVLSHLGVRARQQAIPFVACEDHLAFEPLVAAEGKLVYLLADSTHVSFSLLDEATAKNVAKGSAKKLDDYFAASPDPGAAKKCSILLQQAPTADKAADSQVVLLLQSRSPAYPFSSAAAAAADFSAASCCPKPLPVQAITLERCGAKAATCALLHAFAMEAQQQLSNSTAAPPGGTHSVIFDAANCMAFPYGTMEWLVHAQHKESEFQRLIEELECAPLGRQVDQAAAEMQQLIMELMLPEDLLVPVHEAFGPRCRLVIRSSANTEDLKDFAGAGLYESVANVAVGDLLAFQSAVVTVWASLYSRRAVLARRAAAIPQHQACMAVLIQDLITPDLCFILHTVNPLNRDDFNSLYAEVAPGLGETLASGKTRGSPYRLIVNKSTGELTMLAFCNYSHALVPVMPRTKSFTTLRDGKNSSQHQAIPAVDPANLLKAKVIDYTLEPMTLNSEYRLHIAHCLAELAVVLEEKLGGPQDVEGVISRDCVWVVQSRPQKTAGYV